MFLVLGKCLVPLLILNNKVLGEYGRKQSDRFLRENEMDYLRTKELMGRGFPRVILGVDCKSGR